MRKYRKHLSIQIGHKIDSNILYYFRSSIYKLSRSCTHSCRGHTLSCRLTKVSVHINAGAFPFTQLHNRQIQTQLMYFRLRLPMTLLWLILYSSFITIPWSVNHGRVSKQLEFKKLSEFDLPKAPLTPIDLRYSHYDLKNAEKN